MLRTIVVCLLKFSTLNDINPSFIKDIFQLRMTNRSARENYNLNLGILKSSLVSPGTRSLRNLGSKVWNSLPYHIIIIFKTLK